MKLQLIQIIQFNEITVNSNNSIWYFKIQINSIQVNSIQVNSTKFNSMKLQLIQLIQFDTSNFK